LRELQKQFGNALVVVGVHSPKFDTEKSDAHVRKAVMRYHLDHPVVNDAQLSLWRALGVEAWPTVILVDPDGYAVGVVAGEGVKAALTPRMEWLAAAYRAAGRLDTRPLALALESARAPKTLLSFPGKILVDGPGKRIFIADSGHDRIVVTSLDGAVKQIIGTGKTGRADGPFDKASFHTPQGMALVGSRLYVADTNNHLIRAVDLDRGIVTTVAGTGKQLSTNQTGAPPLERDLSSPWDVNWLNGELYIAMAGDHRIWRYDPGANRIEVFAGSGREARQDGDVMDAAFAQPSGLANDGRYLYVADSESSSIRRIDPVTGETITLAGGDLFDFGHKDATGLAARFQHPLGLAYSGGKLYIADTYNDDIRVLNLANRAVTTLAGQTTAGKENGTAPRFYEPAGLSFYQGMLYVADTDNGAIRIVNPGSGAASTLAVTRSGKPGA